MVNYLFIDTNQLNIPNNYNFRVILDERIKIKKYIKLVQAVIPFDSYLIDQNNCTFSVNQIPYSLPIGNYDISSLTARMQQLVRADQASFAITFSSLTYRVQFSNTVNFSLSLNSDLAYILGFQQTVFNNNNQYIGTKTPNINSPQVVLLNIQEIPDAEVVQPQKYDVDFSFLIINSQNRGSNIQYYNQFDENRVDCQTELRQLTIQVYKNNGAFFQINSGIQLYFQYE
ncbi:hypothetical protein ABPG74_003066 [Tetrahymena malaccensis]